MDRATLREMGLSDENIDKIMADLGKSIQAEKSKNEGYKTDALKLGELTKKLEAMKKAESEKDKTLESKDNQYAELEKKFADLQADLKAKELKANLAEKGIVGENAEKLISSLGNGSIDIEVLSAIIAEKEGLAVNNKVKELEGKATNPNGGKPKTEEQQKTDAEILAQNIGKSLAESNKASADVLAKYNM